MVTTSRSKLIEPYGGQLVDLLVPEHEFDALKREAGTLQSVQLSERSLCDLELLATGAFSPLDRFMGVEDHQRVMDEMRLADGHRFPIPITLPLDRADGFEIGERIALRNRNNELMAIMTLEEIYPWD